MEPGVNYIQDLSIILLAAFVGAQVARYFRFSSVAGYIFAGLLIGTADFVFDITDPDRLRVLQQIGTVFVMFAIGLNTRLSDLRFTGVAPIIAVSITAAIMLLLGRSAGAVAGLGGLESIFFASMLMISSSVTINRQLPELGLHHQRSGQMARSQTMLETILALGLISALGPFAEQEQAGGGWLPALSTVGKLAAFGVLFVTAGMTFVPLVMRRAAAAKEETQIIFLTSILFTLSLIAVLSGYPIALGAFLTGLVASEIPRSQPIERMYSGIRDIFTAVFFVATGMATDLAAVWDVIILIILGTVIALGGRFVATAYSWMVVGETGRRATKIAMLVTPTGAFSLIIVRMGIENGVIPEFYRAVGVGIVFLTGVFGTISMRNTHKIDGITLPKWLHRLVKPFRAYRSLLGSIQKNGGIRFVWTFIRPRILQILREVLSISAIFLLARPLHGWLEEVLVGFAWARDWSHLLSPIYWLLMAVLTLPAMVALLRNLDAISRLIADFLMHQSGGSAASQRVYLNLLRLLAFSGTTLWLSSIIPWSALPWHTGLSLIAITALLARLGWRRLVRIHSQFEADLNELLDRDRATRHSVLNTSEWDSTATSWNLSLREFRLPDMFFGAGWSIDELDLRNRSGASIVGIDRQGYALTSIHPQTQIFPSDTLFLLGRSEQIDAAIDLLGRESMSAATARQLHRSVLDSISVDDASPLTGERISDLGWPRRYGLRILAVRRGDEETINPSPQWTLAPGDKLLVAGTQEGLTALKKILTDPDPAPQPSRHSGCLRFPPPPEARTSDIEAHGSKQLKTD